MKKQNMRFGISQSKCDTCVSSLLTTSKGFTLAEALITLGVIGVVAAITIPVLITNYQKHITVTKLQKAISVLNQAYKLSYDDVGEPSLGESFNMGSEEYFKQYWASYIKTAVICTNYKQCGYKSNNPWFYPNKTNVTVGVVLPTRRTTFYTPDGFLYVIFIAMGSSTTESGFEQNGSVIVDINGGDGPNQFGRDVFYLTRVSKDGGGVQPLYYQKDNDYVNNSCSLSGSGFTCAEKIRRAGWKIEKDYPW